MYLLMRSVAVGSINYFIGFDFGWWFFPKRLLIFIVAIVYIIIYLYFTLARISPYFITPWSILTWSALVSFIFSPLAYFNLFPIMFYTIGLWYFTFAQQPASPYFLHLRYLSSYLIYWSLILILFLFGFCFAFANQHITANVMIFVSFVFGFEDLLILWIIHVYMLFKLFISELEYAFKLCSLLVNVWQIDELVGEIKWSFIILLHVFHTLPMNFLITSSKKLSWSSFLIDILIFFLLFWSDAVIFGETIQFI